MTITEGVYDKAQAKKLLADLGIKARLPRLGKAMYLQIPGNNPMLKLTRYFTQSELYYLTIQQ